VKASLTADVRCRNAARVIVGEDEVTKHEVMK
jgi:hypothetical protein